MAYSKAITFLHGADPSGSCSQSMNMGSLPGLAVACGANIGGASVKHIGIMGSYVDDSVVQDYALLEDAGTLLMEDIGVSRIVCLSTIAEKAMKLGGIRRFKLVLLDESGVAVDPATTVSMRLLYNPTKG